MLPLMGAPNDRDRSARGPVLCTWGSDSPTSGTNHEAIRKGTDHCTGAEAWLVSSYALCTGARGSAFSMKPLPAPPPERAGISAGGQQHRKHRRRKAVMKAITPRHPGWSNSTRHRELAAGQPDTEAHQPICAMTSPTRWPLPALQRFWAIRKKVTRSCSVA